MNIQTIEFKDPRNGDFNIVVHPVDTVDRLTCDTQPSGLWFHYDVDKYSLTTAKAMLRQSYEKICEDEIKYWLDRLKKLKESSNEE
jgi:hypothetical protein